jgi:pimeloyl-ACP methyl ester carboxylesterase
VTPSLFAVDSGGGDTALVLLHGFGASHGVWKEIAEKLSGSIRIIAYDLPGHGGSLAVPANRPSDSARLVLADLNARGLKRWHLAGHSMGGAISCLIAMAEPGLAASLTLLSPGGFGEEINGPLLRRYARGVSRHEIRGCLTEMSGPDHQASEESVTRIENMRASPGQTARLVEIAALITRNDTQGMIPRASLEKLAMPVRILWGGEDPVLPFSQTADLPAAFELHRAAGAGHMLIDECPEAVLGLLRTAIAPEA